MQQLLTFVILTILCMCVHAKYMRIYFFIDLVLLLFSTQAFSSLAESAYELSVTDDEPEPATYPLSAAYEALVNKVLQTADRYTAMYMCMLQREWVSECFCNVYYLCEHMEYCVTCTLCTCILGNLQATMYM